jgi:hypothetical protein
MMSRERERESESERKKVKGRKWEERGETTTATVIIL